jgi:CDP-glycerol glycerophosphotransferase
LKPNHGKLRTGNGAVTAQIYRGENDKLLSSILTAIKRMLTILAKKFTVFRVLRKTYVTYRNKILRVKYAKLPIDDKLVVFEAYGGRAYACSPKAIFEKMIEDKRFSDYKFVWVFRKTSRYKPPEDEMPSADIAKRHNIEIVRRSSAVYYRYLAQTKYYVVNSIVNLVWTKKEGQIVLQCWHGTPLKRLRNDLPEDYEDARNTREDIVEKNNRDTVRYDYLLSPSRYTTEKFTTAFSLKELGKEDIIVEQGYPRNDFLINHTATDISNIKRELVLPEDKKILLYAPTWRDNQFDDPTRYTYKTEADFDYLQEQLGEEWIILFRPHYLIANGFDFEKYEGFIYDASKIDDVNELYVISDALMTDYSSVFFDYANLQRPMIFFMYDLEEYRDNLRGFYIDIDTLPGDIVREEKEIVDILGSLDEYQKKQAEKYQKFNDTYNYLDDGKAAERVVNTVFRQ